MVTMNRTRKFNTGERMKILEMYSNTIRLSFFLHDGTGVACIFHNLVGALGIFHFKISKTEIPFCSALREKSMSPTAFSYLKRFPSKITKPLTFLLKFPKFDLKILFSALTNNSSEN